jgi:predicted alpha/beta-hydrolase family hydrolase
VEPRPAEPPADDRRPRWATWTLRVVAGLVVLVVAAVGVWIALLPDTEPAPLQAVLDDQTLSVVRDGGDVTLTPAGPVSDTTVVFYPGAGVPPDAYLATWAPVVRETSVRVVIPSMPLRLAVLDAGAAADVRGDVDGGTWWVGGHSLGGAMASSFLAGTEPGAWDGLVLWAAYPAGEDLAVRDDIAVVSVAGSRDGLTTPEEVETSRDDLPADAAVVVLDGVNHAQFGTYGDQRGDGEATVDDATARTRIAEATVGGLTAP